MQRTTCNGQHATDNMQRTTAGVCVQGTNASCETARDLYRGAAEHGPWAEALKRAYKAYRTKKYDSALLQYEMLAGLG
jgi:hypothetical protein